jgi:hypothetical protein
MGSNGDPSGESSLALCGPVTASRKRRAARKGPPVTRGLLLLRRPTCGSARRSGTTPCRTRGDWRWPGHGWPGITITRTAAGGPEEGGGAACRTGTPHEAPQPKGSAEAWFSSGC